MASLLGQASREQYLVMVSRPMQPYSPGWPPLQALDLDRVLGPQVTGQSLQSDHSSHLATFGSLSNPAISFASSGLYSSYATSVQGTGVSRTSEGFLLMVKIAEVMPQPFPILNRLTLIEVATWQRSRRPSVLMMTEEWGG